MVKCEYCDEDEAEFKFEVITPQGNVEKSELACPQCVGTWFMETPEDVSKMTIYRLEEN